MASAVLSGVLFVRASRTIVISSCHRSQNAGGGYRKNLKHNASRSHALYDVRIVTV